MEQKLLLLLKYKEKKNIMIVNISEAAVGMAPTPAPLAYPPKKVTPETIDQTSHVYGWGCIFFRKTSNK